MPQAKKKPSKNAFNLDAPLYARITNELRQRITTGQYPIGCLLPTEAELSEEFSTSRHTVREALRRLIEQGMVRSRQGAGTSVISAESNARYVQSFQSISDLFQNSLDTHFVIHRIEPVVLDVETLARLEAKPKQKWLHVAGVRWTKPGGTPICYIDSYVPSEYADVVALFPKQEKAPFYSILEERTGCTIDHVYQEIRAASMPREVANCFGLEEGSLSLQLLRRYVTRSGTLIASFNWHRGDQFTYRMQIDRRRSNEA